MVARLAGMALFPPRHPLVSGAAALLWQPKCQPPGARITGGVLGHNVQRWHPTDMWMEMRRDRESNGSVSWRNGNAHRTALRHCRRRGVTRYPPHNVLQRTPRHRRTTTSTHASKIRPGPGIPPGYIVPIAKRSPPLQHRASSHDFRHDPPALRNLATRSSIFRLAEKARVSS